MEFDFFAGEWGDVWEEGLVVDFVVQELGLAMDDLVFVVEAGGDVSADSIAEVGEDFFASERS